MNKYKIAKYKKEKTKTDFCTCNPTQQRNKLYSM